MLREYVDVRYGGNEERFPDVGDGVKFEEEEE